VEAAAVAAQDSVPEEQQVPVPHRVPLPVPVVPQLAVVPVVLKALAGLDILSTLVVTVVPEVDLEVMAQPAVQSLAVPEAVVGPLVLLLLVIVI
jgi:hypothetical protein